MKSNDLTGIERRMALQYLADANVPVTVTAARSGGAKESGKDKPPVAAVFPVALKPGQISVVGDSAVRLKNPPQSVRAFAGRRVRVEFYFNHVGLCFETDMGQDSGELSFSVPQSIRRIPIETPSRDYDFSADIYYSCSGKEQVNFSCVPREGYELFVRPAWKSIPLENQREAKSYLEKFVAEAKAGKNAGTGVQLIPICHWLTDESLSRERASGRVNPFTALYVDHERLTLGCADERFPLAAGAEYAVKLSFARREGPVPKREMFGTCRVSSIMRSDDASRVCADCVYTSLQEEDRRCLYEKSRGALYN